MLQLPKIKPRIVAPFNSNVQIVRHPRAYDKPVSCRRGQHSFTKTKIVNGLPHLICSKCGDGIITGLHDKTWSKQDIKDTNRIIHPEHKVGTTKERAINTWEKMEYLRSKGLTDEDIKRIYKKKQMGLL